ncbi:MAG: phosphatase PAP2 family protein [Chloroflexi bacterium]|nr:phosphatase PAP2 family protein [Chloroflexota bacterium]
MQTILDWGANVVLWFQQFHPVLDLPFKGFTLLGEEEFFMLLLPLIYWCLDRRTGARLAVVFLFSAWSNAVAKVLAAQPRPFQYDSRVLQLFDVTGGGLPSGHTQNTVVIWGYLAAQFRRPWLWIVAAALMILVPLSRIYLGLHFPTDLLGGYILGAGLLLIYLKLEPMVEAWLARRRLAWQIGLAVLVPALLLLIFPTSDESAVTGAAMLLGMGIGIALERRWVRFEAAGSWPKQALRLALGVAVLFALRFGLKAAFDGLDPEPVFRFVRYSTIGLFAALIAPWAFVRMRLAGARPRQ